MPASGTFDAGASFGVYLKRFYGLGFGRVGVGLVTWVCSSLERALA